MTVGAICVALGAVPYAAAAASGKALDASYDLIYALAQRAR